MNKLLFFLTILAFLHITEKSYSQTNWTVQNSGTTAYLHSVTWTGNLLVAVGNGGIILTSPNGITWTPQTSGTTRTLYYVSWAGEQVITVGANGTILTSPDGITWTNQTLGTNRHLTCLSWTGTQYIVFGSHLNVTPIILTSPDGTTWTTRYSSDSLWFLHSIAFVDSVHVIVGSWNDAFAVILTSSDGIVWNKQTSPGIDSTLGLYDIIWAGDKFVAVGRYCSIISSQDGDIWTLRRWAYYGFSGTYLNSIAWNGSLLSTVGDYAVSSLIATSTDGIAWAPHSSSGYLLNIVRWFGNNFVSVGGMGVIITSSDGTVWTNRTSGTGNDLVSIAFTGSLYVVVGSGGTILTSPLDPTGTIPRIDEIKPQKIFLNHSGGVFTYSLPSGEFVELGIYSISGKKVALIEKGYNSAGEHSASFNAGALTVGTYVYRFRAGSYEESGRVMIFNK